MCYTTWNTGIQKENDWVWKETSVIVFGRAELIEDAAQTSEKVRKLAMKYYPTEEEVDAEMEKAIARVQLLSLHIEHMTGKLVNER